MPAPYHVLFICTGNCCRSQMAEALLRHIGGDRFIARSAGSNPAGYIHPLAIEPMQQMGISIDRQYSKSWDEFADDRHDIILTLCDIAASQPCPAWTGHPATAHWPTPDPSFLPGTDEERLTAGLEVAQLLRSQIEQLTKLPIDNLTPEQLKTELERIGKI